MKALKSITLTIMLATGVACTFGAVPDGYYDSLEGLSGVALKRAAKTAALRNHKAIPYGDQTWEVFKTSDVRTIGGALYYWDMYSDNNVAVTSGKPSSSVLNIEHSVAKSWWGGGNNDAYKDCYHLNPSNSDANSRKSNYPMAEISKGTWDNGVTFIGSPKSGQGGGAKTVYEPADEYKGDFARVFFYMFTVYDNISWTSDCDWMYDKGSDLTLKPWAYQLLLKWAKQDPISQKEIDRNEAVSKKQGNRNPFIDCPELAEYIWGGKNGQPFHYDENYDPGSDPNPDPEVPGGDPVDPSPVPSGYWYAVTSQADIGEGQRYIVVAVDENTVMSSTNAGKYMNVCSHIADVETVGGRKRLATIPTDAAVISLSKSGSGYRMGVYDTAGDFQGYLNSEEAKTLTLKPSGGTVVAVTAGTSETSLSFGNAGKLLYNVSAPRFLTYTSDQKPVMLYRLEETGAAEVETIDGSEIPVLLGIYDINGRKIQAASTDGLEHGIYIVVTNYGAKKIAK